MRIHSFGSGAGLAFGLLASLIVPAHADFDSCLAGIQAQAAAAGVSAQTFRAATSGISYDDKVIELSQAQPEFKTPIWDYMAALVDDERVEDCLLYTSPSPRDRG